MRSVYSFSKRLILLCLLLVCGCARRTLPDPQVVPGPGLITPTATMTATATATLTPAAFITLPPTETLVPTAAPVSINYNVPVVPQDGLTLNSAPTGVGCVPACIEMMTRWWNSIASDYLILTAQETIDRNAAQGLYVAGRGMSSLSAADELAELGYAHQMTLNSSKEELIDELETHGPVGLLVKTNWVPDTMNHAVVLIGYNEESDTVFLNDPFYGSAISWSWDAFDGIWGLNYAGDRDYSGEVVRRVYFVIYPESLDTTAFSLQ